MDADGKFVKSVAMEHAKVYSNGDEAKLKMADEIMDACVAIAVPGDHCENAEAYGKCMHEQATAHGIADLKW